MTADDESHVWVPARLVLAVAIPLQSFVPSLLPVIRADRHDGDDGTPMALCKWSPGAVHRRWCCPIAISNRLSHCE